MPLHLLFSLPGVPLPTSFAGMCLFIFHDPVLRHFLHNKDSSLVLLLYSVPASTVMFIYDPTGS